VMEVIQMQPQNQSFDKISMTYLELRASLPALQKLFSQEFSSMKFLIKLKKLLDECDRELKYFEDVRYQLIQRYGEESTDENGNPIWKVKEENTNTFMQEIDKTLQETVTLNAEPLFYDELVKYSENTDLKLTAMDIKALEKFIKY